MNEKLFFVLMLLQAADVYTTLRILDKGGIERNPVLAGLMRDVGVLQALVVTKCIMLIVIMALLSYLPVWFMTLLVAFYVAVVSNNVIVLIKIERP